MKTKENIETDNYYFYQVFTENYDDKQKGVVFAGTPDEAKAKINEMMNSKGLNGKRDLCLYHKNYKRDSKMEVENGNYLE